MPDSTMDRGTCQPMNSVKISRRRIAMWVSFFPFAIVLHNLLPDCGKGSYRSPASKTWFSTSFLPPQGARDVIPREGARRRSLNPEGDAPPGERRAARGRGRGVDDVARAREVRRAPRRVRRQRRGVGGRAEVVAQREHPHDRVPGRKRRVRYRPQHTHT